MIHARCHTSGGQINIDWLQCNVSWILAVSNSSFHLRCVMCGPLQQVYRQSWKSKLSIANYLQTAHDLQQNIQKIWCSFSSKLLTKMVGIQFQINSNKSCAIKNKWNCTKQTCKSNCRCCNMHIVIITNILHFWIVFKILQNK